MAKKYYAVKIGKEPGVYETWDACKAQVHGFPGAVYKSFPTRVEAVEFAKCSQDHHETGDGDSQSGPTIWNGSRAGQDSSNKEQIETDDKETVSLDLPYAFVDGSFNSATGVYGYGGFLVHDGIREILQGHGQEAEMASMRNVAGEVLGAMAAMAKALELGLPEIAIYYDYMGIEMWATGSWKRNKKGTIAYYDYVCSCADRLQIHFVKVKGHSGVEGNEEADRLAKQSVGIM